MFIVPVYKDKQRKCRSVDVLFVPSGHSGASKAAKYRKAHEEGHADAAEGKENA